MPDCGHVILTKPPPYSRELMTLVNVLGDAIVMYW